MTNYDTQTKLHKCAHCGQVSENAHSLLECPVCNVVFTCTQVAMPLTQHIISGTCPVVYCDKGCGFINKDKHYKVCKYCDEQYQCTDDGCAQKCCQTCGLKDNTCHCDGKCKDPDCTWEQQKKHGSGYYKGGFPQQHTEGLQEFGLLRNGEAIDIQEEAATFYGLLVLVDEESSHQVEVRSKIFYEMAQNFMTAIICACAGEARYAITKQSSGVVKKAIESAIKRKKHKTAKWLKSPEGRLHFGSRWRYTRPFGVGLYQAMLDDLGGHDRTSSAKYFKRAVVDKHGPVHALRFLGNVFMYQAVSGGFGGGFGGPLWSQAGKLAHRYARGEISDVIFLDSAFALQHNNGTLFTKTHKIPTGFQQWLDQRQQADEKWVLAHAPAWVQKFATTEAPSEDKKTPKKDFTCPLILDNKDEGKMSKVWVDYDPPKAYQSPSLEPSAEEIEDMDAGSDMGYGTITMENPFDKETIKKLKKEQTQKLMKAQLVELHTKEFDDE